MGVTKRHCWPYVFALGNPQISYNGHVWSWETVDSAESFKHIMGVSSARSGTLRMQGTNLAPKAMRNSYGGPIMGLMDGFV